MCNNEKAKQTFLQHLPVSLWHVVKLFEVVIIIGKNMQISSKPVIQACNDFKILMHTSKGEQINFTFLFIQFTCLVSGAKLSQTFT